MVLRNAERTFAAKGYDGARIEEIAREAEVNQATIYYYFRSKEELFNAVIESRLDDARLFRRTMKEVRPAPDILSRQVLDFVLDQRDFLKILLFETLTSKNRSHWIFRLMDFIRTDGRQSDAASAEPEQHKLAWFFFALLPAAAFSVFHEQWSDYFTSDVERDKECFVRSLKTCTTALRDAAEGQQRPRPESRPDNR